jgi:hypothetical protein
MELYVQFAGQFGHNRGIIKHCLLHRRPIAAPDTVKHGYFRMELVSYELVSHVHIRYILAKCRTVIKVLLLSKYKIE